MAGFSHVFHRIDKGKLHGFDLLMKRIDCIAFAEREALQNIQSHQNRDAVTVGRNFPNVVAAVIGL